MDIENTTFEATSKKGHPAIYSYRRHSIQADSIVIAFPGQAYYMDAPVMWYSSLAALESGYDVLGLEYSFQVRGNDDSGSNLPTVVKEVSDSLSRFFRDFHYKRIVFVAKSIGTVIASEVIQNLSLNLEGFIFLTPLERVIGFMNSTARKLIVVGDSDPAFPSAAVREVADQESVFLVPDSNHILEVPGNSLRSIDNLKDITSRCGEFLRSLPSGSQ